jgi:hypothetical protein
MGFRNPILGGGGALVYPSIHSPNFVAGSAGWSVNKDGSAEFSNGVFRGTLSANSIVASSIGSSAIVSSDFQGGTMEETVVTFDDDGGQLLLYATTKVTTTITTTGPGTFNVPAGVTEITVKTWGAGAGAAGGGLAGGANSGGQGGGGGAFAQSTLTVTPLAALPYSVGAGGSGGTPNHLGTDGGATNFNSSAVKAPGGKASTGPAGKGGQASAAVGDLRFSGGNGGTATGSGGSGGGEGAASNNDGNDAPNVTGSSGGSGGSGTSGANGGAGGNFNSNGHNGSAPGGGGGGGGGDASAGDGGGGGDGQIIISYVSARQLIGSATAVTGTDSPGNTIPAGFMGQIVAVQPGSSPQIPETWHSLGTLAHFTVTRGRYRMTPWGDVEIDVHVTGDGSNASSTTFSTALSTPYRPASVTRRCPLENPRVEAAGEVLGRVEIDTSGNVTVIVQANVSNAFSNVIFMPVDA